MPLQQALATFLERNSAATFGENETDWLQFCEIEVLSGMLCLMDPMLFPGIVVEVAAARYAVQVRLLGEGGVFSVSTLRVLSHDAGVSSGVCLGQLGVDFACVTVGDAAEIKRWGSKITSVQLAQPILNCINAATLCGYIPWNTGGTFRTPFVRTPGGDGRFEVRELSSNARRAGAQILFRERPGGL